MTYLGRCVLGRGLALLEAILETARQRLHVPEEQIHMRNECRT